LITTQIDKFRIGPEKQKPRRSEVLQFSGGQPDELTPEQNRHGKNADP
jgi:hypothetical protein